MGTASPLAQPTIETATRLDQETTQGRTAEEAIGVAEETIIGSAGPLAQPTIETVTVEEAVEEAIGVAEGTITLSPEVRRVLVLISPLHSYLIPLHKSQSNSRPRRQTL